MISGYSIGQHRPRTFPPSRKVLLDSAAPAFLYCFLNKKRKRGRKEERDRRGREGGVEKGRGMN